MKSASAKNDATVPRVPPRTVAETVAGVLGLPEGAAQRVEARPMPAAEALEHAIAGLEATGWVAVGRTSTEVERGVLLSRPLPGACLATCLSDGILVLGAHAEPTSVAVLCSEGGARTLGWAAAARAFRGAVGPTVRLDRLLPLERVASKEPAQRSPWRRLADYLRFERRDVATLAVFAVVLGGAYLAVPLAVQVFISAIAATTLLQPLVILGALLLVVMVVAGILELAEWYLIELLQRRLFARVVEDAGQRAVFRASPDLDGIDLSERLHRIFDVVSLQKVGTTLLVDGLNLGVQAIVGVGLLAMYHPLLLVYSLAFLGALTGVVALGGDGPATAREESTAKYDVIAWIDAVARRTPVTASRGEAAWALERMAVRLDRWISARKRHFRVVFRQMSGIVVLWVLATVLLLAGGGWLVMQGELSLGQLVAAELVVSGLSRSFAKAGKLIESVYDVQASMAKLGMVMDLPVRIESRVEGGAAGEVVFEDLVLVRGTWRRRLEGTFVLGPRARVGIDAPEGAGTSTLLEVLAGVRRPAGGRLYVPNAAGPCPAWLREHALLVSGDSLLPGTLRELLTFGGPSAADAELWAALAAVGLERVVAEIPGGLDAPLDLGGGPLSRRQRIRLHLARVWVRRPRIVLLDGVLDGLRDEPHGAAIAERLCRPDAPWCVVVASRDPRVLRHVDTTWSLDGSVEPEVPA